jgi:hypothetical protein
MNLVELHKVAELYGENFSLQIFTQKDHWEIYCNTQCFF